MARKSAESLSVATVSIPQRPEPPKNRLNASQQKRWREVVKTKPADWWDVSAQELLIMMIQHETTADLFTNEANSTKDIDKLDKICRARERETRAAASFATKLRLLPQNRYAPSSAHRADKSNETAAEPWK